MEKFKLGQHETLYQVAEPWDFENDGDAKELEKAMCEFMLENKGIGLAANQIGLLKRVFVMGSTNIPGFPKPFAVFNPEITDMSDKLVLDDEGCLSFPGLYFKVSRPEWIQAKFYDRDGNLHEVKMDGYLAKCFQHEFDHLNGICYTDRVSKLKLDLAIKKMRKNNKYARAQ